MTEHYRAVILDPDACLEKLKGTAGPIELELTNTSSPEDLMMSVVSNDPDLVVIDIGLPNTNGWLLAQRLRNANPAMPMLLLSNKPDWTKLEKDPYLEIVRSPADMGEVIYRIGKLLSGLLAQNIKSNYRLPHKVVEELRGDNGRIDARKIAEMFDLSISTLARIIRSGEPALYKTPDALSVQPKLIDFERIAWGLIKLTGSAKGLRIWLNTASPELENELPMDYIKKGHVKEIAAMVEDALLGHPS